MEMHEDLLLNFIQNPEEAGEKAVDDLKQLITKYPYFQTARVLYLKYLALNNYEQFIRELPMAAIYAGDRKKLYYFLHPAKKTAHQATEEQEILQKADASPLPPEAIETSPVSDGTPPETIQQEQDSSQELKAENPEIGIDREDAIDIISEQTIQKNAPISQDNGEVMQVETLGFIDWLNTLSKPVAEAHGKIPVEDTPPPSDYRLGDDENMPTAGNWDLIDSFLNNYKPKEKNTLPGIESDAETADLTNTGKDTEKEIVSETLADIFIAQGKYNKAIAIFKKLGLKYPEKSTYFAGLIKNTTKLKKEIKK